MRELLERLKTSQANQWRLIVGGGALATLVWRAESLPEGWYWWLWYLVSLLVLAGSVLLELYLLGRQEARRRSIEVLETRRRMSIEVLEKRLSEASVSKNLESRAGERQNLDELLEEKVARLKEEEARLEKESSASHPGPLYLLGGGLLLTLILLAAMSLNRTKAYLVPEGGDESVTLRGEVIPGPWGALTGVLLVSSVAVLIGGVVARSPVAIGIGTATLAFSGLLTVKPDFNVELPLSGLEFTFERDELAEAVSPLLEHVGWTAPFRPGRVYAECGELLNDTDILSTLRQDGVGTVILLGHADERPPRVGGASEEPTNRGLAERRAERVGDCLREGLDPPPPPMLSFGSGPLNLGRGDEALWEKDRRVLVLALRQESVISGENRIKIQVRVKDKGTANVNGSGMGGGSSRGGGRSGL